MTQDLDALPLPAPTHFRNGVLYAFSADQIRADRIKVWELAMRKAQEGREPVGEVFLSAEDGKPVPKLYGRYANLPDGTKLYIPPPPPKSDEAMASLAKAVEERDSLRKAQEWREPVGYIDEGGRAVLFPARKNWLEKDKERDHAISRAQQYYSDSLLYTSPPPKSDEAMDALIKAARWFADNPDSPRSALGHITEALAALAAQQSKGEA